MSEQPHVFTTCRAVGLGFVLVASREDKIRAVSLGDDETRLQHEYRKTAPFPVEYESSLKAPWVALVMDVVEGRIKSADEAGLMLDLWGTLFQKTVWQTILQTKWGERITYAMLASRAGVGLSAARAVAQACGQNRLAVLVPCHRIIPANLSPLAGYRWGIERKQYLLQRESPPR